MSERVLSFVLGLLSLGFWLWLAVTPAASILGESRSLGSQALAIGLVVIWLMEFIGALLLLFRSSAWGYISFPVGFVAAFGLLQLSGWGNAADRDGQLVAGIYLGLMAPVLAGSIFLVLQGLAPNVFWFKEFSDPDRDFMITGGGAF